MKSKITVILEGLHHCKAFREILDQLGKPYDICSYENLPTGESDLPAFAQSLVDGGTKVIISAGKYSEILHQSISVPIVTVRRSKISFAIAVNEAHTYAGPIAILARKGVFLNAALQYKNLLAPEIPVQGFETPEDLGKALESLRARGINILITGTRGKRAAEKLGFQCISVPFEMDDILFSLKEAEHILSYIEHQDEHAQTLLTIQNNISEGVIVLDRQGEIIEMNQLALDIFGLPKTHFLNKSIANCEFAPLAQLTGQLSPGKVEGEIVHLNEKPVSISCSPIVVAGETKSYLITIAFIEQVQNQEWYLRSKLYAKGHTAKYTFGKMIGASAKMQETIEVAKRYAKVNSAVFLSGLSGSGKEVFAQSIHNLSDRRSQPFVVINCAALPQNLLESILFGYEKGAYTGALKNGKKGLFEIAHGGTVFLDEVSEMSVDLQSRFLRVLQEKEVTPIGSDRVIPIDIRIISASNRDMQSLVESGAFREDLFYRLAVLWLDIPSLSERREDIPSLIAHFLSVKSKELRCPEPRISEEAMHYFCALDYPGQIRQLGNIVERLIVLSDGQEVSLALAQKCAYNNRSDLVSAPGLMPQDEPKDARIRSALRQCGNSRVQAARLLGISTSTLWRKMKKYQLL